jgi:N-acetylneuraminic acid mutarotase
MAVGVINGKIVAALGYDPGTKLGDTKATRIYDIATDSWTTLSRLQVPGGERSEAGSVAVGKKLYVVGGGSRTKMFDTLIAFDLPSQTWTKLASLPPYTNPNGALKADKKAGLGVAALNGEIYAIGGRNVQNGPCSPRKTAGVLGSVEKYDIASNTWVEVAPLPTPRSDVAAVAIGSKIWVFGGCTVSENGFGGKPKMSKEVDSYDPATDTWTKETNMPVASCAFSQVAAIGSTVYIIGGYVGATQPPLGTTWAYDTTTGASTQMADMMTPRAEMGVVAYNGSIYTVGGSQPAFGNSSTANERFTP